MNNSNTKDWLKCTGDRAGFTLIELLIVVLVITILAVVLIPKGQTVRSEARLSGLNTNMNAVHAVLEARRPLYAPGQGNLLEEDIANRVNRQPQGTVIAPEQRLQSDYVNPVSKAKGMAAYGELTEDTGVRAAFTYYPGGDNEEARWNSGGSDLRLAGTIAVAAFEENGELVVKLYPFDDKGRVMSDSIRLIR